MDSAQWLALTFDEKYAVAGRFQRRDETALGEDASLALYALGQQAAHGDNPAEQPSCPRPPGAPERLAPFP
jgi:acyl-CoA-binding protein